MSKSSHHASGTGQLSLLAPTQTPQKTVSQGVRFRDPDPELIVINNIPLRYLLQEQRNAEAVFEIRKLMRSLDWSEFEKSYQLGGR